MIHSTFHVPCILSYRPPPLHCNTTFLYHFMTIFSSSMLNEPSLAPFTSKPHVPVPCMILTSPPLLRSFFHWQTITLPFQHKSNVPFLDSLHPSSRTNVPILLHSTIPHPSFTFPYFFFAVSFNATLRPQTDLLQQAFEVEFPAWVTVN